MSLIAVNGNGRPEVDLKVFPFTFTFTFSPSVGRSAATGACEQSLVSFISLAIRYVSICPKRTSNSQYSSASVPAKGTRGLQTTDERFPPSILESSMPPRMISPPLGFVL